MVSIIEKEESTSKIPSSKQSESSTFISPELRRMHYIHQEFVAIARDPIEGIYVSPSTVNPLEWFGLLIVRAGIFCGGMFRFTLKMPHEFPDAKIMPVVQFDDTIFHPLINPKTNVTDLTRYFPSGWQRDRNHIYQILTAVQSMFFRCKIDPAQALNAEAAILISQDLNKFKQMARDAVRRSRTQIYDVVNTDDEGAIRFTPWNESEMEVSRQYLLGKRTIRDCIVSLSKGSSNTSADGWLPKKAGFSWIDHESCRYMCDLLPIASTTYNNCQ